MEKPWDDSSRCQIDQAIEQTWLKKETKPFKLAALSQALSLAAQQRTTGFSQDWIDQYNL